MARILVTGSRGTLGVPLVEELKKRKNEVWQCDLQHHRDDNYIRADVSSYRHLERVFEAAKYDYVYHLAAEFGRVNGEEYYDTLWQTNVIGTRNILEWQKIKKFRLIFASSSEIYGDKPVEILKEELPMKECIIQHNDYAVTKWVNEIQIMNFQKRFKSEIMRLRLFNAYGPGEHYHRYRSVVCLFCYRALFELPYQVYEGYHRVFMYIDDFIPTFAAACDKFSAGEVYNIGGTEYRSVKELSDIVLKHLGKKDKFVEYLPEDKHNVVNKRPDIEKAKNAFGHNPKITLEQGVPETIEWMKNIPEISRNPDISIIIPCLNEEQNIPQLVNKLDNLIRGYALAAEVLIVDDCSDDYTFRESFLMQKDFPFLRALHKGLPRGIGHSIRYGIKHSRGKMAVVVMGDLVDPIAAIVNFQEKIIKEGYQLALLSRYLAPEDHKNIPLSYKFYQWWYRFLCRILVGIKIRDITYAFRAFDLDWARGLNLESGGFEISPEISLKTYLKGGRICEIKGRQGRRLQGESKFLFSKEGSGYARVLLKAAILRRRY